MVGLCIAGCGRAPQAAWTASLPEPCRGAQPWLSDDWALVPCLRQWHRWRRSDGAPAQPWPAEGASYLDAAAALGRHLASRHGSVLRVLGLDGDKALLEAEADAGPFADGERFYWSRAGAVTAWSPQGGPVALAELGASYALAAVAQGEGVTLLAARAQSDLQVTLNKGLVVAGYAVALDAGGRELWRTDQLPLGAPLIRGGAVYFVDHGVLLKRLHALSLRDGRPLWQQGFGNAPSDPAKPLRSAIPETPRVSPPLAEDGTLLVGVDDGDGPRVLGLDPASGAQRWAWRPLSDVLKGVGEQGPAFSYPVLSGGLLLLGVGARVQALEPQHGGKAWAFEAAGPVLKAPAADRSGWLAAAGDRLHYASQTGR